HHTPGPQLFHPWLAWSLPDNSSQSALLELSESATAPRERVTKKCRALAQKLRPAHVPRVRAQARNAEPESPRREPPAAGKGERDMRICEPNTASKIGYLAGFVMVVGAGCAPSHSPPAAKVRAYSINATIEDPSFEDELPGGLLATSRPWVGEEPGEVSIENDGTAHTGAQYARMIGSTAQLMQMVDVTPYTGYRVSAWVSGTPGIDQHATQPDWIRGFFVAPRGVGDVDNDGDEGFDGPPYLKAVPITTGTGAWRQIELTFNSGPNTAVSVNFDARFFAGEILKVDDVSVTEEPDTPPLNPSLSGTVGDRRVDLNWT